MMRNTEGAGWPRVIEAARGVGGPVTVWLVTALLALGLAAAGLEAQITGRVQDMQGRNLDQVVVEAWGADTRISVTSTTSDGLFAFPESIASELRSLYAHRLGYRASRVNVTDGVTHYVIRMAADPFEIEGLVVTVEADRCQGGEESAARDLWSSVRQRYDSGIDSLGAATYLGTGIRAVPLSEIGPVSVASGGSGQRGSAPLFRASWRRRVERTGYARPLSAPSPDGMYEAWGYAPLEAEFATHFVDEVFGKLHRFNFADSPEEGWSLRFCPRDDDRPSIDGYLRISPDSFLVVAEWSFRTDEPDESAGGRAVFAPGEGGGSKVFLLPSEGLFWRRVAPDRYLQRYERFEGWMFAPGDSVPFLPVRGSEGV